ncbi:MAG: hypothetical protein GY868_01540 [Deltaproteobacteria bacterium]|nr:hypothetical protein [Deltaproteobacteria bacterium]
MDVFQLPANGLPMEQALYISRVDKITYYCSDFSRLYFGQEFCERLLPDEDDLQRMLDAAAQRGLAFTLVTPYVTNQGLEQVEKLLAVLERQRPDAEVVFNDWGVLGLLRDEYSTLTPVLGRLLNKMKRGPRIVNIIDKVPQPTRNYFQRSSCEVPSVVRYLKKNGIVRVEFDNLLQGLKLNDADDGIHKSLYLPYAFVSTTRFCLTANCDRDDSGRERVGIFSCGRECAKYTFELENPVMRVPLIRRGNTLFFCNEEIPDVVAQRQVDRIVIEPEIPL